MAEPRAATGDVLRSGVPPHDSRIRRGLFQMGRHPGPVARRIPPIPAIAWVLFLTALVFQDPAARGRRIRTTIAYWRWQWHRRRGRWLSITIPGRGTVVVPSTSALGPILAATGSFEPDEESLLRTLTTSGDFVVDGGAHVGYLSIILASAGGHVLAVEPTPSTASALRHNVVINGLEDRVTVIEAALSERPGRARFTTGRDVQNRIVDDASEPTVEVAVTTVDELTSRLETDAPVRVLKLDLEGHDLAGLKGAAETVERHRPVILIETRAGGHDIRSWLDAHHYIACWYDSFRHELVEVPSGWAGNAGFHTNLVGVPAERVGEICEAIACAPPARWPRPRVRAVEPPEPLPL